MREPSRAHHFIGLDVGTYEVRCVVGMLDPAQNIPSIVGHGSALNLGMRKGTVVHIDDVAQALSDAVAEAERISGIHIHSATVNVNGSHVGGLNSRGVIAISAANREIMADDRLRAEEAATIMQLPPNREIVQVFAKNYRVDGQDNIKDPVGMRGVRLEVDTHIVTASSPTLRSLDAALEKASITPSHHTFSGLACAEAVLTRQQKEAGTLLLDIGAGTTNCLVVEDGEVQHVAIIPMGGINITNDLAIGLKTELEVAEAVKIKYGGLAGEQKKNKPNINIDGKTHYFEADEVNMIIEARVDELMDYVDRELRKIQKARKLPGGVVIVGGSAKLPGIAEFVREKLQLPARIGHLQPVAGLIDHVDDLSYITPIGLMLLDMLLSQDHENHAKSKADEDGLMGLVTSAWGRIKKSI